MTTPLQTIIQGSRSTPFPVSPDNVPEELKERTQWVVWRQVKRPDGKRTKKPFDALTGRLASTTDLMTWSPFEEAYRAYDAEESYAGVGFVFSSGDPYVGVDLDACVDPHTGEVEMWAQEIVQGLDSYTELSPSGTGLHIIVRAKDPSALKRNKLEMYGAERFFTVTGHLLEAKR